ncbi:metal-nicotianamine transporter YSL3-like protein, partial [Tanacetum coccineum]
EASSGVCKVLHWEFHMGFFSVVILRFYFDFSMTYIGAGMICSHLVNLSLLAGALLSYGVMWPLIGDRKGDWFSSSLPENSMKSLNGYK